MRDIGILLSALLLTIGLVIQIDFIVITGACFYLIAEIVSFISVIHLSQKYKRGEDILESGNNKKTVLKKVVGLIGGIILIAGLILLIVGIDSETEPNYFVISGGIIWFGSIIILILSGIITKLITDLPIKWGYGGWYIAPKRKK